MICSSCGTENDIGRKFCGECATPLAAVCPSCGSANGPTAKFCGECATPLVAGATPAHAPGIPLQAGAIGTQPSGRVAIAERRLVSILFADLVGFTTLAEGRDAEDTRELLSGYFDVSRDIIGRYGGTVEKFIGDAVMAVWGAPVAHEDDAERAVRAALELVDAVRALGPGILARAGVLTGEAAVTIGATNQGMVAGDLVNTASRLQSAASPGSVLVGEATERAASRAIVFEAAGDQTLKGKTAPVPAWRAIRVVAERGGRRRSETLEAPFVGRDDELRLLKDLFHATTRERRARLVSAIGPAGIGKSRLAWEFTKYTDGLIDPLWFHTGRSPAYGDGISFWALGEMVRGRAGLSETDDEPMTRRKIAASVSEHVPDESERRWIESALLALLGIEAGSVASDELFAAWRTYFERMAHTAPVVMLFEDFHHADSGLIDFVDHLLEWARSLPIYVVTLSRPELLDRRPGWMAGKRSFTSVFLEPLPDAAMTELLAGLVPGLPESAERAIIARAGGIPLYAIETVRMLLAEGRLTLDQGVYRPTGDLTDFAVPETLTALIASRLDTLAPLDRTLVSDAAVLGQSFTLAGLAAVSGFDDVELAERLRSLAAHEILALDTDPRSPERGQYAFVQALIREVAYNALAKRDRKVRHLAAARYFESLETDEIAGALAGHYLAAYRSAAEGAEAEAVGAQARIALGAAAHRAAGLRSFDNAVAFLEQALTVTTDPAETAHLLERAGETATDGGRHEVAKAHLTSAVELNRTLADRAAVAGATAALGRALLQAFQSSEALAVLEPAAKEFADLAGDPAGIALLSQLGRAYFFADDNRRSIELSDRVLEAAEHADLIPIVADTLVSKGTALASIGRVIEGIGVLTAGRDLAESRGFGTTVLRAENNLAYIESARDPRSALERSRAGLALARRLGIRSWISGFTANIGEFALRTGDWTAALAELGPALAEDWETSDRFFVLVAQTVILSLRGEPVQDARDEVARLLTTIDDPQFVANGATGSAQWSLAAGDLTAARAHWHRAGSTVESVLPWTLPRAARLAIMMGDAAGARDDLAGLDATGFHGATVEAERLTIRAGIAALDGDAGEAGALYREALRAWQDLGLAWDEALCGLEMAMLLDVAEPEVAAAAAASHDIFVRLEAAPFLARLEDALGRARGRPAPADAAGAAALADPRGADAAR